MAKDQVWRVWIHLPGRGAGLGLPKELRMSHWASANGQTCLQEQPSQGPKSTKEQGSACSSLSFAFTVLPLFTLG